MRPFPGDDAFLGRPRATSSDADFTPSFHAPTNPQMTFFVGDEAAVDSALQQQQQQASTSASASPQRPKEPRKPHAHTSSSEHGPPALAPAGLSHSEADDDDAYIKDGKDAHARPSTPKGPLEALKLAEGVSAGHDTASVKSFSNLSQPMTPTFLGASGPASVLSSISSRRNSLSGSISEDGLGLGLGAGSQPPCAEDEENTNTRIENGEDADAAAASRMMDSTSSSVPQLIMPSIKMPSRRPFTAEGKAMGRLKVLIAGDSGVGKTSLVKAVVQSCEHIVHVDPITPSHMSMSTSSLLGARPGSTARPSRTSRRNSSRTEAGSMSSSGTREITEICASTKPYPEWWSEMDDLRILKRRKSLGDTVLDRNVCFVDTPGYGAGSSSMDTITPVVQYVEAHLQRLSSNGLSDGDALNLVGGDGGVQIDVVFYMVSNRLRPVDIHYLQQLNPLTNIIILLSQADLMSSEQVSASKDQIFSQLKEADIRPFSFAIMNTLADSMKGGLYAVSSATGSDHDTMDASLLMSPDYVQPLFPTELSNLVDQVFSANGVSWLRHAAARKYIQWRKGQTPAMRSPMSLYQPRPSLPSTSSYPQSPHSSNNNPLLPSPPAAAMSLGPASNYALARMTDHTQREERLAQIRLANWAADLQRSLANERAQYEALSRSERAFWLTEKLNECVQEGTLVPVSSSSSPPRGGKTRRGGGSGAGAAGGAVSKKGHRSASACSGASNATASTTAHHQDPLGLLEVVADLRRKGLVALEVLGSLGVLGGLALWVSRQYWHVPAYEWMLGEWERFWYGAR